MFKILTYRQILFLAVALSVILVVCSFLNSSEAVFAPAQGEVSIPIVMYHQISENEDIFGDYVIPPSLLEADFEYLKKIGANPISLKELESFLGGQGTLPRNPVILTFDDGQRSFLTKVLPLLEKYKFPACINIIGSLAELYSENGETDDRYAYLNKEDIKILAENPLVELGCHTYNLHSLSERRGMGRISGESDEEYKEIIRKDLERFNLLFSSVTGEVPRILAYPYGIRSDFLLELVKEAGFKITLTCRESQNHLSRGSQLYELGRFNRPFGRSSEAFFEAIL